MKILVTAATAKEIKPLIDSGFSNYMVTGVGGPAYMYMLTRKLAMDQYDLVIQAGIAGTFTKTLGLSSVVNVVTDVFADLGVWENGTMKSLSDCKLNDPTDFPYTHGRLENLTNIDFGVPKATGITVNTVTDNSTVNDTLQKKYDAQVESMEGAYFHYVCLMQRQQFLQLRAISNTVGDRNKDNWDMSDAIDNLNNTLQQIIGKLNAS